MEDERTLESFRGPDCRASQSSDAFFGLGKEVAKSFRGPCLHSHRMTLAWSDRRDSVPDSNNIMISWTTI